MEGIRAFFFEKRSYTAFQFWGLSSMFAAVLFFSASFGWALVNAASFDSSLVPSVGGTYKLGLSAGDWQSINNTIFFSGSNVGIGVAAPGEALEVNGGTRINTTAARPTCAAGERGTFWVVQSGSGVKDTVSVCIKNASDTYTWASIY